MNRARPFCNHKTVLFQNPCEGGVLTTVE
jgi:hypothetical protein